MTKWILTGAVLAVVGFFAQPASAQETIKSPGTVVGATTIQSESSGRTGVLRRFQDRRGRDVVSVTPTTTTTTTPATTAAPVQRVEVAPLTTEVNDGRTGLFARLRGRLGR